MSGGGGGVSNPPPFWQGSSGRRQKRPLLSHTPLPKGGSLGLQPPPPPPKINSTIRMAGRLTLLTGGWVPTSGAGIGGGKETNNSGYNRLRSAERRAPGPARQIKREYSHRARTVPSI